MSERGDLNQKMNQEEENLLQITYFTDPLCCWSWGFEPQWRRLRYEFRGQLKWRYRMCGMLPNWDSFDDPLNSVNRPLQMGPVWMEASHISGMPMDGAVWHKDPPGSSFPACVAVKCAGLQSPEAEEWFLRRTREAVMLHGENIAKQEVLTSIAETLSADKPELLDSDLFRQDLTSGAGNDTFREDLQEARYHRIGRYPTLTIERPGHKGVIITGYRPYDVLLEAVKEVAKDLQPASPAPNNDSYKLYWDTLTEREIKEVGKEYQT